ncbi:MAG TPA: hypothetical protein DCK95_09740 [Anaerolineaceae bacterium]|nr:hypothetical protein [Anaerolineaceae bacterium]
MDRKPRFFSFLSFVVTIACAVYLINIPSEGNLPFLFGLSTQRICLLALFVLIGILQIYLPVVNENNKIRKWINTQQQSFISKRTCLYVLGLLWIISWYFSFLPVAHFPGNQAIFERLKPLILWIFLQLLIWFIRWIFPPKKNLQKIRTKNNERIASIVFLVMAIVIWIVVAQTKMGLKRDIFWDSLGVPLTITQVVSGIFIVYVFRGIIKKQLPHKKHLDTLLFFIIWVFAALLWINAPQYTSTFNPGPFLPNNEFYPNSDAQTYDACALSAMQGQPFCAFSGNAVSKPLYTAFLFFLHLFSGNSYRTLINLQVIFIALLPALIFLIGKELHSRPVGLLASVFAIMKIYNSMANSLVIWTVSTPKFMMSEPFLSVFLALFCFFLIKWYRDPEGQRIYLYLSGAVLGLCTLIRDNVWALLPIFLLFIFIKAKGSFWKRLSQFAQFGLMCLLVITPWAMRNTSLGLAPVTAWNNLKYVIFENRYGIETNEQSYDVNEPQLIPLSSSKPGEFFNTLSFVENNLGDFVNIVDWDNPSATINTKTSSSINFSKDSQGLTGVSGILSSTINHLLHNLLAVFLSLPITFQTGNVEDMITTTWEMTPWSRDWDGTLGTQALFLVALNLIIISAGIFAFRRKSKKAYSIPMLVMLTYLIGVAFAKTSGGRYIVPVDWIVLLFYAAGLIHIIDRLVAPNDPVHNENDPVNNTSEDQHKSRKSAIVFLVILCAVSILLPLLEKIYPPMQFPQSYPEFLNSTAVNGDSDFSAPFTAAQVQEFLMQDDAVFLSGQALYPKVLDPSNDSATEFFPAQVQQPYSLSFTLLAGKDRTFVYMPIDTSQITFPNGLRASLLGCKTENGLVKAKAVFVTDTSITTFYANDLDQLICEK